MLSGWLSRPLAGGDCRRAASVLAAAAALTFGSFTVAAQNQPAPGQGAAPAAKRQAIPTPAPAAPGRGYAPGVLTTIEPAADREDAISLHDVVELRTNDKLKWDPASSAVTRSRTLYEMAHDSAFVQDVWCLEFSFKPLRMLAVDVPQPDGKLQRKLIWYLVYRVRNTGAGISGEVKPDGTYVTAAKSTSPIHFQPQFVLVSQDQDAKGERVRKAYLDRVIPAALGPISRRERPDGKLLTSVEMAREELPAEEGRSERGLWGVAMWEDVDPEMDFFSVFVGGLSNAYRWNDPEGAYAAGDPPGTGRKFTHKVLQLNFWRPGDEIQQNEREFRYGPAPGKGAYYDSGEGVAYQWVYR